MTRYKNACNNTTKCTTVVNVRKNEFCCLLAQFSYTVAMKRALHQCNVTNANIRNKSDTGTQAKMQLTCPLHSRRWKMDTTSFPFAK